MIEQQEGQSSISNTGQKIVEMYLAIIEQQSNEIPVPNQCYGEFSNSTSWKQFSNHNNPFSQSN